MVIYKGPMFNLFGRLDVRPKQKERGRFLNLESCHPPSLHAAWPIAYARRLWARSATTAVSNMAKVEFFDKLRKSQVPEDVIGWVDALTCYTRPYSSTLLVGGVKDKLPCFWQPLTYHPSFASILSRSLRGFLKSEHSTTLLLEAFGATWDIEVRFAWKLPGVPFGNSFVAW